MSHKSLPVYRSATCKVSYKIFQLEKLCNVLDNQHLVALNSDILFAGQTPCEGTGHDGTVDDKIARAKQRAYQLRQRRRPSSKSVLVVGRGKGRSTRKVEVIWWPDLYSLTKHGQMTLRLFIEKCDFKTTREWSKQVHSDRTQSSTERLVVCLCSYPTRQRKKSLLYH